jgi:addiction module RelE/StbE family toxin
VARVIWSPQAREDLKEIVLFIKRDSPTIASAMGHRITRATRRLAEFPRSGRIVPEFKLGSVREVFVQSYRVIYEYAGTQVDVLTVVHGARRLRRSVIRKGGR